MTIWHASTERLAKKYRESGFIRSPVRGFTSPLAAMAWSLKIGRKVIYQIDTTGLKVYKLPDHHNQFGLAVWVDADVDIAKITCFYSAGESLPPEMQP